MKKLRSILTILALLVTCINCSSNEEEVLDVQQNNEYQITIVEDNKQEGKEPEEDIANEEIIDTIEDKQEEVKEEIKVLDNGANPNYNYWVTFYDHDGNILQQDAIKYGTVPTYWSDTPYYDDGTNWYKGVGWTDAYGRDVIEFQPIKGNTRFYAKYEVGGAVSHSSSHSEPSNPTPAPSPACSNTDDMYYFTYASYDGWASWQTNFTRYRYNGSGFNYGIDYSFVTLGGSSSNITTNVWYHSSDQNTFVECTDPNHHEPYEHVCPNSSTYLLHVYNSSCDVDVYQWNPTNSEYEFVDNRLIDFFEFDPVIWSDTWVHTNDVDHPGLGSQTECIDHDAHVVTCFVAGTQVQYDLLGHTKNIEDFKIGDQIVSYNVNTDKYYLAKVGRVFIHDGYERVNILADVILEDGSLITMTTNHPVLTKDGFRAIDNKNRPVLKEDQFVMTGNGWTKIKKISVYNCEPTVTYNLGIIDYDEIIDDDTYDTYIAGGIVVHNLY